MKKYAIRICTLNTYKHLERSDKETNNIHTHLLNRRQSMHPIDQANTHTINPSMKSIEGEKTIMEF